MSQATSADSVIDHALQFRDDARALADLRKVIHHSLVEAENAERLRLTRAELMRVPLAALNDVASSRLGIRAIGLTALSSVQHLLDRGRSEGASQSQTFREAFSLAELMESVSILAMPVRFDLSERNAEQTTLLYALFRHDRMRQWLEPMRDRLDSRLRVIDEDLPVAARQPRWFDRVLPNRRSADAHHQARHRLGQMLDDPDTKEIWERVVMATSDLSLVPDSAALWHDYAERPGYYERILHEFSPPDPLQLGARESVRQLPSAELELLLELRSTGKALLASAAAAESRIQDALATERARVIHEQLERMSLEKLQEASGGRLRIGPLVDGGYDSVGQLLESRIERLEQLPGVGNRTANQAMAAARSIETAVKRTAHVRFDVDTRPATQTALLSALHDSELHQRRVTPVKKELQSAVDLIGAALPSIEISRSELRCMLVGRARRVEVDVAVAEIAAFNARASTVEFRRYLQGVKNSLAEAKQPDFLWSDYQSRAVLYNGLLIESSGQTGDDDASTGFLPEEIVERVRSFELDTALLKSPLRGYQIFGAKFALLRERTIIGDEMGLGKTVEALAAISHLRSHGERHFLVVCPTSVLANWEHEVARHTMLGNVWRLHGTDRDANRKRWAERGGLAVTTYSTLRALERPELDIAVLVADEAHYAKNPKAKRTQVLKEWIDRSRHVLLMTGTPMENNVEEFRTLVHHVAPDVARTLRGDVGLAGPEAFRREVASVYLRRNQIDVLNELPPMVEVTDWLAFTGAAESTYRQAVAAGHFMDMRRAAFMTGRPEDSPKLQRLREIASEAMENGRKVVVFSYFLEVVDRIHTFLGADSIGTITGRVPADERQRIVDRFASSERPAVLVSQIQSGGTGMNMQAGSVVILAEPQWKPTLEEQAIARCHRLGQVRPVEVHRLLVRDSVDERMLVLLGRKSALFDDYARKSSMKESTPDAVDVTDEDELSRVASEHERERRIIEMERQRMDVVSA